jgi:AP-1 complex subunit gamma-1
MHGRSTRQKTRKTRFVGKPGFRAARLQTHTIHLDLFLPRKLIILVKMAMKMRDLIRAVRSCKTAAEERAVISKECALIRTAIKEEDEQFRYRNVAKLMYIHMLGYPTHFGQMECLKLISAPSFPDKRIGYLALTLLMNEQNEVLTLVTNSLKLDLTNPNQYIQGLALIVIGNLATQDMARDLASDVDKLLRSANSYLRKKAALATIRLLKKEPDLIESVAERIVSLIKDRAHGVLLTGVQLMIDVLNLIPEMKAEYQKLVPSLVRLLRNFLSMGFSPEHDVAGITDPFMQVSILRILRFLGKGNEEASEQMNDILAQVATNTETTKNAGNAILYECVQTIMEVQSDASLRVLAVNILGRFLLNRDNNIRYVALNSLSKVVNEDVSAVQRHRATIVDCLKDADISIRTRALELIYQLVNEQNVIVLTTELLNYLVVAQSEQRATLSSKIMQIVERYSPGKKWRIDTIITMLSLAGNQVDESVIRTAIIFIAQTEGFQAYAVHKLYRALQEDTSQLGLLSVGVYTIGEFGDLLVRDCNVQDIDGSTASYPAVSEAEIVGMLDKCSRLHNADLSLKAVVLNSMMKLTTRLSPGIRGMVMELLKPYRSSISLELQQRSTEYSKLLTSQWDGIRGELLGKMPVIDEATMRRRRQQGLETTSSSDDLMTSAAALSIQSNGSSMFAAPSNGNKAPSSLLDLDDIFGGSSAPALAPTKPLSPQSYSTPASAAAKPAPATNDLLADIFSLNSSPPPAAQPAYMTQQPMPMQAPVIDDIFGLGTSMPVAGSSVVSMPMAAAAPVITAFDKNGFQVSFV